MFPWLNTLFFPFSFATIFFSLFFIFVSWISFFLPGRLLLQSSLQKFPTTLRWAVYLLTGVALWGWQGYIFGWLHLRFLTIFYLLGVIALTLWQVRQKNQTMSQLVRPFQAIAGELKSHLGAVLLGSSGLVLQMLFVIGSGWRNATQEYFYFLNGYDGVMHLAFTQELVQRFPAQQPGAIGIPLTHYHYWADLVAAELSRIWALPISLISFQLLPLLLGICGTIVFYGAIRLVGGSKSAGKWGLFWWFFAGNALPWLYLAFHRQWNFSLPVIDHGLIQFSNTPQAFAKFLFITGLILWGVWMKKKDWRAGIASALVLASLWGFKVYFGMFAAIGWTAYGLWLFWSLWQKQHFSLKLATVKSLFIQLKNDIALYALLGFASLAVYLPANVDAGGLFYVPLAWPKLIISPQYLNWSDWWLRRQVYEQFSNWKWLLILDVAVIAVFFLGVFSTRLVGLWAALRVRRSMEAALWWFLVPPTLLFIFIGMNFLQTSGEYNVFNFFVVALLLLTFFLALWTPQLLKNIPGKLFLGILVVLSVIFPAFLVSNLLHNYWRQTDKKFVNPSERQVNEWIIQFTPPEAVVQPVLRNTMNSETPWTPFFTNRQAYLAGTGILRSHNQPIQDREKAMTEFEKCPASSSLISACKLPFDYLVSRTETNARWVSRQCRVTALKPVFISQEYTIWQVDHAQPTCQQQE